MYKVCCKRLLDIILSILALPFIAVIILLFGILIFREDRGTVFYNSLRLGKNGRTFKMYKLRSMKLNAPDIRNADGSTFNSEQDPRLTSIGRFIRKTSIDELPQIWNVLKGDMSFVGPRPDLPEHMYQYDEKDKAKLCARPGITGYNQAYFRNSIPWKERLKNDVYYVENITFMFDVKIVVKTIVSILHKDNVYIKEHEA